MRRASVSVALIVVAAGLLVAGTVALYARTQIVDERSFADRAVAALDDDAVREAASREIVARLIDRGSTDLVAGRPLLESVVDGALRTGVFRRLLREAAIRTNRALFVREQDAVVVDLSESAGLVASSLRSVSPKLARALPEDFAVVSLGERPFATRTLVAADWARVLGPALLLAAVLLFAAGIALAPDRRIGVLRSAVAVGSAGALLAVVLLLERARLLSGLSGSDELSDEEVRDAAGGLADAFLGDLLVWALAMALFGLVLAGAVTALEPRFAERVARPGWLLDRPAGAVGRAARGVAAIALALVVIAAPWLALQVLAIVAGAYLLFFGSRELVALLPQDRDARAAGGRRRALAIAAAAGVVAVGGAAALVAATAGGGAAAPAAAAAPARGCNGSVALCGLRLNQAVFAGTHNSFSAADAKAWFIADQRRTIPRQLRDGIRLFLIDTHWGVADPDGRVRTDFDAEARDRNKVAAALPPPVRRLAERAAGGLGLRGRGGGERKVYLCHTVCELGATKLADTLTAMREFLDDTPGEVVIVFVEPYVPPDAFAAVAAETGIDRYAATLERDEPLPTLGELVAADKRLIVLAEEDADGTIPWYLDGFSFVQDTPLRATKPDELSCDRYRGSADSPLLMFNHWADVFPPRLRPNRPFLRRATILDRGRRCARERGMPVNLIAVDHYDQGDLVGAVAALNAERAGP